MIGCPATGNVKQIVEPSASLKSFKSIKLEVKLQYTEVAEDQKEKAMLEQLIIERINNTNSFQILDKEQSKVEIIIQQIKKVNNIERVLLGAMAGQAKMNAIVKISASDTGKIVNQFEVEDKSSGGSIFTGTTEQAVEMTADYIVKTINN